jgi:hypothetical protein
MFYYCPIVGPFDIPWMAFADLAMTLQGGSYELKTQITMERR